MDSIKEHQKVLLELLEEFARVCQKHNIKYILFAGSALGAVRHSGFIPWDDDLDVAMLRSDYDKLLTLDSSEWKDEFFLQREFSEHWPMFFSKLRKNNTTCLEKYHPKDPKIHQGIYIDIFPCDNAFDNTIMRWLQFGASRIIIAKALHRRGYETRNILKKVFVSLCNFIPQKKLYEFVLNRQNSNSSLVHSFLGGTSKYRKGYFNRKWFVDMDIVRFENKEVPISKFYNEMLTKQYGDYMIIPSEEERSIKVHAILVDTEKNYTEYINYRDGMNFDIFTKSIR